MNKAPVRSPRKASSAHPARPAAKSLTITYPPRTTPAKKRPKTPAHTQAHIPRQTPAQAQAAKRRNGVHRIVPVAPVRRPARLSYRPVGAPIHHPATQTQQKGISLARQGSRIRRLAQTVFINQNFAKLWWGQAISSVGDYTWDTALVLWIATFLSAGQSWSPIAVSGVIVAAALPQIIVGPIAGVFVDRWDKRRTMSIATGLQALIAGALTVLMSGLWHVVGIKLRLSIGIQLAATYGDVFLLTSCAQFFIPAQLALIKSIVERDKQDQAIETSQGTQGLAVIIGPPVAAALVFGIGVEWALVLNTLSFVVSLVAARAITAPPTATRLAPGETGAFSREFLAGFGYVLRHKTLRVILIAETLTWLGFGALQTLGYFFITEELRAPPNYYGWLGADFGVGAIVGALLVTLLGRRIGLERLFWIALVTSGAFVLVLSHLTDFYLALGAAFLFGVSATAIIIAAGPLALDATKRKFVGRVTAVINPIGRLAAFVSVIIAGALVGVVFPNFHATVLGITFRPVDTVLSGLGALVIAGGIFTWWNLRQTSEYPNARRRPLG